MAAVVSHAMRRFPPTPPDPVYTYGLRAEGSKNPKRQWSGEEGESSLSRSMRYADPWLYGSVRAPGGLLLAPAFALCSCADYLNGTKRSSKKGPTTCKKCKGARLPLSPEATKFGTVRCYPTATTPAPLRAGTLRVSSSSRPSILPSSAADPYDLMRRSRLSVPSESSTTATLNSSSNTTSSSSQFRGRSISPSTKTKSSSGDNRSLSASRTENNVTMFSSNKNKSIGRRSILECDINPYELMSLDSPDSSITLVNGQRIRVRPKLNGADVASSSTSSYEDVDVKPPMSSSSSSKIPIHTNGTVGKGGKINKTMNEKESESINRFKSILKKRTTTFNDTDSSESRELSPSPAHKSGSSYFYLPMPGVVTPRKKVQFLVENELVDLDEDNHQTIQEEEEEPTHHDRAETEKKVCKLRRSVSERINHEASKVVFNDTMALRNRTPRGDSRITFSDLEKLDGLGARTRKKSPPTPRPNQPPPPPPPPKDQPSPPPQQKINPTEITVVKDCADDSSKVNDFKVVTFEGNDDVNSATTVTSKINEEDEEVFLPPSAPPRKRSNSKQPVVNVIQAMGTKIDSSPPPSPNKTVVQINGLSAEVHKLQIRNEFADDYAANVRTVNVPENPQRKTSILITGDDCYSTVNVNDDVPLYQSSVVVTDAPPAINTRKSSSSVYITGNFTAPTVMDPRANNEEPPPTSVEKIDEVIDSKDYETYDFNSTTDKKKNLLLDTFGQSNIPSSELLQELLKDPVEAVRRNLVPHVCGKSDVPRRQRDKKRHNKHMDLNNIHRINQNDLLNNQLADDLLKLKSYDVGDDLSSEHSSSTQYELMDASSECYTDHSNRSSITEEELANRTKFYELLADSDVVEVENEDHHYESIKINPDPIYEEIEIPPPLPSNPPPSSLLDDLQLDKEYTTRSIFEGASKYDILSYLVDAKERGIVQEDTYNNYFGNSVEETKEPFNRVSHMSTVSDSSEDNSLIMSNALIDEKATCQKAAEVERNDSGVGSETSKSSLSKYRTKQESSVTTCEDCESIVETLAENEPLICRKCFKKRSERKEIIMEIVETEEKYSRDLQIILEEFYQPMLVAGLLTPEQLSAIFLNAEELLENSQSLAERLRDAVEIALEQGDEDLLTVNIGKLFLEAAPMLHGFETYCVRQGSASLLLASLEKDKELLRIFLRVSQMENTMLRRMNLNSFLMVPVQRVTKYPLLLARLYKVTPAHHDTKEQLKEAQHKIELHLNHMNSETKDVPSKLWRRIGSSSGRRSSAEMDLVNIKLRKIAVDVLEWNHDEAKFALEGRLLFTQPTDNNWRKGRTIKLTPVNALLVINGKPPTNNRSDRNNDDSNLVFSRHSVVREAALLLVRDKNGRYSLLREPLYLDRCVIAADPAWQSYFEVQELMGKDTFIFKAEDEEQTKSWYNQLQYHAQGMGAWRKRRNALANIMINGMGLRS